MKHFTRFCLGTRPISHGLFDADNLAAARALAEAMTGAIHFVPWPKPTRISQFGLFHIASFPQAARLSQPSGNLIDPLPAIGFDARFANDERAAFNCVEEYG